MEARQLNFASSNLFAKIIGIVIILTAIAVLVGWRYHIPVLMSISPSRVPMKVNGAICFLLSGFAVLLLANKNLGFIAYTVVAAISMIILLIAGITIIEFVSSVDWGIDQLFIKESSNSLKLLFPGRMSFLTSVDFIFVASAFLSLIRKTPDWLSQTFAEIIFIIGLFSFCNYLYDANTNFIVIAYTTMAIHTSLLFILLGVGILFVKADTGIIALLLKNSTGGYYARKVLPAIFFVPILLALTERTMAKMGLSEGNFGDSIITSGTFAFVGILIFIITRSIDRGEEKLTEAQADILQNEVIFREFTNNIDIVFYRTSPDLSKILYTSPAYEKIWGQSVDTLYKNPKAWFESILPEDQPRVYELFFEEVKQKSNVSANFRIKRPDGSIRNIFSRAVILKDKNNMVFCLIGIAVDMTEDVREKKYIQMQLDIALLAESATTIDAFAPKILQNICRAFNWDLAEIWLVDEANQVLRCVHYWHTDNEKLNKYDKESRKFTFKYGEDLPGSIWEKRESVWFPNFSQKAKFLRTEYAKNAGLNCTFGIPIIFQGKVFGVMEFFSYQIQDPDEKLLALMDSIGKLVGDFIQRAHTTEQIQTLSRYDILTGLVNRSTLIDELSDLISNQKSETLALLTLDIDNFKLINIRLGHDFGDEILKLIAQRLKTLIDYEKMNIARVGANKFILYYQKITHRDDILDFVHKIERTIKDPFHLNEEDILLTVSTGIACYPQDGSNSQILITHADLALAEAKKQGGNKSVFFTPAMSVQALDKATMHSDLRQALAENQFFLNLQPQIDLKTGEICGAEALARWRHPVKGLISPNDFIGDAEQIDLIIPFNEHIMRMVFQLIKSDWVGPPIAINISAQQFKNKYHLVEYLESLTSEFNVNPKHIHLEITESMVMDDSKHCIAVLGALNHLGFQLAIDDFGTGFSSFNYLYRIPADKVKIDRSFITGLPTNKASAVIVKSMITMLHTLGKQVIAEGAETEAEIEFLKQENCDIVQGYYYYKPMSTDDFIVLVAKKSE